ncbi:MAG TPA: biotin carboxylase N-terminal domain-containing protein, partial [Pseudolabrys sp.]
MFKRILIANRGEIACRIIKTARKMRIETVAVYSEADRDALHVAMADAAVAIGPPLAAESYLVIENIIAACKH